MSSATVRLSRTDDAYTQLRRAILRGELRPNERLIEVDLAEQLQISRTPIREVLQRLGTEGLIVRVRRGWRVREHTPDEIGEIYEVRAALESYAAWLAAERAGDEELERIRAIHADADSPEPRTARDHLVEVNDDFHEAIVVAAHNTRLIELARQRGSSQAALGDLPRASRCCSHVAARVSSARALPGFPPTSA
jgi:DNA-binding GntR family transcriptional regulator